MDANRLSLLPDTIRNRGVTKNLISINVTSGKKRHPTLGDYVTVYSNASVLGGDVFIGSGSVIGGSAFVTESVPENARVGVKDQEVVVRRMGEPEPAWCYVI